MAAKKNTPNTTITERPDKVVSQIIKTNKIRGRKAINDWTQANNQAGNAENPKRALLYSLYEELVIDGEIYAEWETKRKLRVLANDFNLLDANNKPDETATDQLKTTWFNDFVSLAMDSKLWGHSLIEVDKINTDGLIASIELVRRKHVIPEKGLITIKVGDEKGIAYRDDAQINQWLFEVGKTEDLGLLNICAPYVLFMRFALSAWSEFCEVFAMPLRVGKTQSKDTTSLNKMNDMLLEMATASYAVIDKDEEIQFIESNKTDGSVYNGLMTLCASKISKILNGAVIGEATQSGSRAKEQVGQQINELVTLSDTIWLEGIVNDIVLPKLIVLGYPFDGLKFKYIKQKDLAKSLEIVTGLSNAGFKPTVEWVQDEFGIPLDTQTQQNPTTSVKAQTDFFA